MLTLFSDLTELELPDTMKTVFPDPSDVLNFNLTITPDEGEWVARDFRAPAPLPFRIGAPVLGGAPSLPTGICRGS